MGLSLSLLVGSVALVELAASLRRVSAQVSRETSAASSTCPCLSYHDSEIHEISSHDSLLCGIGHSGDIPVNAGAIKKLENLHEYSLRVKSQLWSLGASDWSTLSDCDTRSLFSPSRADSGILELDSSILQHSQNDPSANIATPVLSPDQISERLDIDLDLQEKCARVSIPPEPSRIFQEVESSISQLDRKHSFSDESSNQLIDHRLNSNRSDDPSCPDTVNRGTRENSRDLDIVINRVSDLQILPREPTTLPSSEYAEVSRLTLEKSTVSNGRQQSDISEQTTRRQDWFRDDRTDTLLNDNDPSISTTDRPTPRATSISVAVQTSLDEHRDCSRLGAHDLSIPHERIAGRDDLIPTKPFVDSRPADGERRVEIEDRDHYRVKNDRRCSIGETTGTSADEQEFFDAQEPGTTATATTTCDSSRSSDNGPIDFCIPTNDKSGTLWLIFSGEYTKAMNKDWHSGHFCCWQCDESLTGQRYVLRDEHPYCIKCYESVFANGCEECNKIIGIDSKDLSYKDKHWHEACFLCNKCRVSLVDKQFGSKVDKIYCGNCYDAQFASRCDGCSEIFRAGTKKMEYKTRQWHEKCFCCVVCKNPIGTKSFIPREQEIYCAGCYEDKFATRCVKCNKIITSGGVTYKNEPWHRDCFTCSNCDNSLAGQRFTSRDDKPYCAECFGELFAKRCTACTKPITGIGGTRFISFEDRHWHNNCFICAGCKTSLVGRGFITDGDDIICPECAKQKLSE